MYNSGNSRRENAELYLNVIARSNATKQSSFLPFFAKKAGLLRRFAPRNDGFTPRHPEVRA
jgi:hypothetical protein